jgi:hypothetical protein
MSPCVITISNIDIIRWGAACIHAKSERPEYASSFIGKKCVGAAQSRARVSGGRHHDTWFVDIEFILASATFTCREPCRLSADCVCLERVTEVFAKDAHCPHCPRWCIYVIALQGTLVEFASDLQ